LAEEGERLQAEVLVEQELLAMNCDDEEL